MLGRYDESYVYEKETDILSDSDPTDCDEEYGDEEAALADSDPEAPGRAGGDEQDLDDLDFIDTGPGQPEPGEAPVNRGHCTYHPPPQPPCERRPTLRAPRRASRRLDPHSPGPHQRQASTRAERRSSRHRRSHAAAAAGTEAPPPPPPPPRAPSEKKRLRCSARNRRGAAPQPPQSLGPAAGPARPHAEPLPLNRVLVQRMLARDAPCGTRSAGNTPVSLRRRLGELPPASRLAGPPPPPAQPAPPAALSATFRPLPAAGPRSPPLVMSDEEALKRRSNSLSGDPRASAAAAASAAPVTFASELALLQADQEAERKYRQLITDAEQILLGMRGTLTPRPRPPFFLNARYLLDDCRRNGQIGCEVVVHAVDVSRTPPAPGSPALGRHPGCPSPRPASPALPQPHLAPCPRRRIRSRSRQRHSSPSDSSDGSSTPRHSDGGCDLTSPPPSPPPSPPGNPGGISPPLALAPTQPLLPPQRPPLMTFRSVDLGGALDASSYCPQSEPVKRKVYAGSATLDRLQRSLEKSQHQSLRIKADMDSSGERGGAGSLQMKLEELRRERLQVEAKVREARDEERRRMDERAQAQRQLTLLRRQMLVQTIEGLKRSLEDQSARLHEAVYEPSEAPKANGTVATAAANAGGDSP